MIQLKIFTGTIAEIESAFNAWSASLMQGTNINSGPLVLVGNPDHAAIEKVFMKEVLYVLPVRDNGKIAVPQFQPPRGA